MSATGRSEETAPAASDIAARLRDAGLVRLVGGATGDAVAAVGLFTLALEANDVAHQSSVVAVPRPASRATDADLTVALGRPAADAEVVLGADGTPASATALAVASELGAVDYELGLAGIAAAGDHPSSDVLGAASDHGIDHEPGIATPTPALADGLAHSGLVHTSFSGDRDAASRLVEASSADEDADGHRRLASVVAVTVCEDDTTVPAAADAVEGFLRPLVAPGGRFETVEGYGDVLDATARASPELGVPLALGAVETTTALETWRTHTQQAHEAVRSASTGRYDGLFVVQCSGDAPLGTVARLVADYRSPEPLVLALDDTAAVARTATERTPDDHVGDRVGRAASRVGGAGGGSRTRGRAEFDGEPTEFVAVFREER